MNHIYVALLHDVPFHLLSISKGECAQGRNLKVPVLVVDKEAHEKEDIVRRG